MDRGKILIMTVLTLLAGAAAYTGINRGLQRPLSVGFIGTTTGKYAALGSTARDGAFMAVEEINAAGGIHGRPLEASWKDDGGDPEAAAALAMELDGEGVRFVIGPFLTSAATAALPVLNRAGMLTISGTTMGQNLADRDDNYFIIIPNTGIYGRKMAELALSRGFHVFGAVSDSRNDPYCSTFLEGVRAGLGPELAEQIREVTFLTSGEVPYSEIISRLEPVGRDAVFLCASPFDTAMLAQHIRSLAGDAFLLSTSWGISGELIATGGQAVEGLLFFQPFDLSNTTESFTRFLERYRSRYGKDPTYAAILNYEAVTVLAAALEKSGTATPESVRKVLLENRSFKGVQDDFSLDREGDIIRPLILHTIREGDIRRAPPP